ncbi:DUF4153 domain-containing protein [Micromonospora sp. SL1-18]|uniref:DUF4153 domain-containing protein n=1 Tax=Micromonospora sp. SL1-18 TaxID=3399128 RepID=UPI003A4DD460
MSEPSSAPDSPRTAPESEPTGADVPADVTPYLLVMPTVDGAPPGMVWPGQEGQPAWAIPVTVPPGTRGYAVFVPLLPTGEEQPVEVPGQPAAPRVMVSAPGVPAQATPPAVEATPAAQNSPAVPSTTPATDTTAPASDAPAAPGTAAGDSGAVRPAADAGEAAENVQTAAGPAEQVSAAPTVVPPPGYPPPYAVTRPVLHPGGGWAPRPPVPRTSFLGARWPGPKQATGQATPLAVLAGALGTAFFVPLSRVGIGWFLGWLTLTLGVLLAVRRRTADLPRTERLIRVGWAVAALALLAVPAFRNAWWLVTFCVLGALGCATLAIVGGRLVRSILFGLVATPFAAFRGLPWVRRHITASPDAGMVRRVAGSVVATVLVLVVFGSLLASADAAFSELVAAAVPDTDIGVLFRGIFLTAVGGLIAVAAVYTLAAPPDLSTVDKPSSRRLSLLEWAPAIGALTLLFAGFVVVQFTVLFGGERHVQVAGLKYSEYARSGFWQLLFVTLLTLAVLTGVSRLASREQPTERLVLRIMLGLLSALSVVIVVSALSRMWTYQKVYSFTGERIFVMAFELLLGAVFLMILAAGVRWQGRWIPGTTVALAVAMLLGLAVLNPEDYAARRNILRYEQTGKIDAWYLRALSADATPALAKLPDPVRRCTLSWIADNLDESDPWYAWNLGRYRARQELDRLGPNAIGGPKDCRKADQFDLPKTRRTR